MVRKALLAVLTALTAALLFAATALAASDITLTFVRHAESQANADGVIDTSVPGPHLTEPGRAQADAIAAALAGNGYDAVYVSDMIRTTETAAPLAELLHKTPIVLPGLHEIDAGIYEGASAESGLGRLGYALAPVAWTLGAHFVPMPGSTDFSGDAFDARVDAAVQTIYDSGSTNAVAFSHGATIMFWTLMNVDNPDLGLLLTHQLGNTGVVVVHGNPTEGWTLVSWDGVAVDQTPSFGTKLFVNFRDMVTTPQAAVYAVGQALVSGDLAAAAKAFVKGVVDTVLSPVKFAGAVIGDVVDLFHPSSPAPIAPEQLAAVAPPVTQAAEAPVPATAAAEPITRAPRRHVPSASNSVGAQRRAPNLAAPDAATPAPQQPERVTVKRTPRMADAATPGDDTTPVKIKKPARPRHDRDRAAAVKDAA